MSDLYFAAVSAAMFVVIRTKLAQMERKSETSFSYQSERSTSEGRLSRLQSILGLSINRTGILSFDRIIRFMIG